MDEQELHVRGSESGILIELRWLLLPGLGNRKLKERAPQTQIALPRQVFTLQWGEGGRLEGGAE